MAIADIQSKQGNINLVAEVIEIGEVREFQKFGKPGRVCTAVIKDDSGKCNLSLWNEQIDQIKAKDKIKLTDGYASEWQGQMQVTSGRNGTIEVLEKDAETEPPVAGEPEPVAEEPKPVAEEPKPVAEEPEMSDVEEETIE